MAGSDRAGVRSCGVRTWFGGVGVRIDHLGQAVIGIAVAVLVLPTSTRAATRADAHAFLTTLAALVRPPLTTCAVTVFLARASPSRPAIWITSCSNSAPAPNG